MMQSADKALIRCTPDVRERLLSFLFSKDQVIVQEEANGEWNAHFADFFHVVGAWADTREAALKELEEACRGYLEDFEDVHLPAGFTTKPEDIIVRPTKKENKIVDISDDCIEHLGLIWVPSEVYERRFKPATIAQLGGTSSLDDKRVLEAAEEFWPNHVFMLPFKETS